MNEIHARCLLADDHPALLAAVSDYLADSGFELVGVASDGPGAVGLAERSRPDVAVVDFRMPRLSGRELLERLRESSPDTRIAVYTADADQGLVEEALGVGAAAVVLKEAPLPDLVRALQAILSGRVYVDPALAAAGLTRRERTELTEREREVLSLLAEGLDHEAIGERLQISAETVRTHVRKACDRLGAATRTQAVATAVRRGLIE